MDTKAEEQTPPKKNKINIEWAYCKTIFMAPKIKELNFKTLTCFFEEIFLYKRITAL